MGIAYISEHSPLDLNKRSGTPHYVHKTLSEIHTVVLKIRMQKIWSYLNCQIVVWFYIQLSQNNVSSI